MYEGKVLTVKDWFGNKKAQELGRNLYTFHIFAIIKETEKAVYAIVDLGYTGDNHFLYRTFWIPKSAIIEDHYYDDEEELAEKKSVIIDLEEGAYERQSKALKWQMSLYI